MNRHHKMSVLVLACVLAAIPQTARSRQKLPMIDEKAVVATVDSQPIFLEELDRAIAGAHGSRSGETKAGRVDFSAIMRRLINTRLILIEAGNIGLDELPKVQELVEQFSRESLMEMLLEKHVQDITADEEEVETRYKEIIREWRIRSASFKREEDVKKAEAEIRAGRGYEEVVTEAVERGLAETDEESRYIRDADLTAPMARLIPDLEVGSVSPIISIGQKGFLLFKLEGVRYPEADDPDAKRTARLEMLDKARVQAARDYVEHLKKRYLTLDKELFDSIDYESPEPGIEALLKDERIIAEISGEAPITVGQFTGILRDRFYHGFDLAIESRNVNRKKRETLEDLLQRRLLLKESLQQGLDKTGEYRRRVDDYKDSLIFGAFVEKVIRPEIKIGLEEMKVHYEENIEAYSFPEMMRIKGIVFANRDAATNSMDLLHKGTDFQWLSTHAEGQLDKGTPGTLTFDGKLLTVTGMPEGVQEAVSGATAGDFRLYESPEGHFYVLYIYHLEPSRPRPFDDVREAIAEAVFHEKEIKILDEWTDKLREYYPVKIYRKDLKEGFLGE